MKKLDARSEPELLEAAREVLAHRARREAESAGDLLAGRVRGCVIDDRLFGARELHARVLLSAQEQQALAVGLDVLDDAPSSAKKLVPDRFAFSVGETARPRALEGFRAGTEQVSRSLRCHRFAVNDIALRVDDRLGRSIAACRKATHQCSAQILLHGSKLGPKAALHASLFEERRQRERTGARHHPERVLEAAVDLFPVGQANHRVATELAREQRHAKGFHCVPQEVGVLEVHRAFAGLDVRVADERYLSERGSRTGEIERRERRTDAASRFEHRRRSLDHLAEPFTKNAVLAQDRIDES